MKCQITFTREIKFRVWDNRKGSITYGMTYSAENHSLGYDYLPYPKYYTVMQFTGLLDKDDEEIYEGDIVKIERTDSFSKFDIGVVFYWSEKAQFALKSIAKCKNLKSMKGLMPTFEDKSVVIDLSYWTPEKVLGNVFENPNLIK